jgi:SAM-dependent methyltransferase
VSADENPYDALPYHSRPIPWATPESLALTSLLHGGPRTPTTNYRVLELGCGDGTHLLALAQGRPGSEFVGVDGSTRHIEAARTRANGLDNLRFVHADLRDAAATTDGRFEYVLAHGVLSWVPDDVRDAILGLHRTRLAQGGLVYLNYNAKPGWNIRGMVREFLLAQTDAARMPADQRSLRARTEAAMGRAAQLAATLDGGEHPYSRLLAQEFQIVATGDPSYIAHEYLSAENHAYWRSEFTVLAASHGLQIVADADFTRPGGRGEPALDAWLAAEGILGRAPEDTSDLLRYRQLHSPVLTAAPWTTQPPTLDELGALFLASDLTECEGHDAVPTEFRHAGGQTVDVTDAAMREGLLEIAAIWPRGRRVSELFADVAAIADDLALLHRFGLAELRCVGPDPLPLATAHDGPSPTA